MTKRKQIPHLFVAAGLWLLAITSMPAFGINQDKPDFGQVVIAPPDTALTFAKVFNENDVTLIAVTRYHSATVEGIKVSALFDDGISDPVTLFQKHGYDKIYQGMLSAPKTAHVKVPAAQLGLPVQLSGHHIAAGTNYREHATETEIANRPFLFAKIVTPTAPHAPVAVGSALLDYEVELAFVTLDTMNTAEPPKYLGLLLCNDYSDRESLMRKVNIDDIESGQGFTTGKSKPGFLPVGNLFVIPRHYQTFVDTIELKLYVDDQPRQRAKASSMIWEITTLLEKTWDQRADTWVHQNEQVHLQPGQNFIEARTLIMSGTPDGTIFQGVSLKPKIAGLTYWLFSGFDQRLQDHVTDAYAASMRASSTYLQAGQKVTIHADYLGLIHNRITP